MKDHIKGEWVNRITDTAKKYGHTQQLRTHIHEAVMALIGELENEKEDCYQKYNELNRTISSLSKSNTHK